MMPQSSERPRRALAMALLVAALAAPSLASARSLSSDLSPCAFEGYVADSGEWLTGPTLTCFCNDGKWEQCFVASPSQGAGDYKEYKITVENLSFNQPFGAFAVATHDGSFRLFEFGQPASSQLVELAEDGDPQPLADLLDKTSSVRFIDVLDPVPPMQTRSGTIRVYDDARYITLASMAINTNDCFMALNGDLVDLVAHLQPVPDSQEFYLPGLDAGSEENNELCSSIPGPACPSWTGNVRSLNGEGAVHVHRGFFGVNEGKYLPAIDLGVSGAPLEASRYDWRNPMARVVIEEL